MPTPGKLLIRAAFDLAQAQLDSARRAAEQLVETPRTVAGRNIPAFAAAASVLQRMARPIVPAPWNGGPVTKNRLFAWLLCAFAWSARPACARCSLLQAGDGSGGRLPRSKGRRAWRC